MFKIRDTSLFSIRSVAIITTVFSLVSIYILFQQRSQVDFLEKKLKNIDGVLVLKIDQLNQEIKARESMADKLIALRKKLLSFKVEQEALEAALRDEEVKLDRAYPNLKDRIKSLHQSVSSLTKERRELKLNIKRLNRDIISLSEKDKDIKFIEQDNKRFKFQLKNMESDYKILIAEKDDLLQEIKNTKEIEKNLENLNIENLDLKHRLSNIEENKNMLAREIKILRLTVIELKHNLHEREKGLEAMDTLLKESKVKTGLRAEEILELQDDLSGLTEERDNILKVIAQKESKIKEKIDGIQDLESKLTEVQEQFQKQKEKVVSLSNENSNLKAELKNFKTKYKSLSTVLEDVSSMNTQLQNKIGSLDDLFSESKQEGAKDEKSIVDLGSMKIDKVEPEVALTSLIYQLKNSQEYLSKEEQELCLEKEAILHYNLGVYYLKNDRFKEALDEFLQGYEITPDDSDTVYNIGLIYRYYIYDYDKARHYFARYLKLNPRSKDRKTVEKILEEISR